MVTVKPRMIDDWLLVLVQGPEAVEVVHNGTESEAPSWRRRLKVGKNVIGWPFGI
jgi:hypothetical protein